MSEPQPPKVEPDTPTGIAREVTRLAELVDALAASSNGRDERLQASLATVLEALNLLYDDDPGARRRLRQLRLEPGYEDAFTSTDPLVSIVIPTWDSIETLLNRSIPSALAQTHANIEVIVVGDCAAPEVGEAVTGLADQRVRFANLSVRGPYDENPHRAWLASGTPGLNAGVGLARGQWIAPLGDDDAFVPEHVERLLREAQTHRLEFVYGRIRYEFPDGRTGVVGAFPPRSEKVGLQAAVYHAGLRFMELELGHALFGKPNDWGLVHRMMRVGVRMGMVEDVSVDYWPSMRALERAPAGQDPVAAHAPTSSAARTEELELQLVSEQQLALEAANRVLDLERRLAEVRDSRSWRLTAPLRRLRQRG